MPELDKYEQAEPWVDEESTSPEASFDPYSQVEPMESSGGSLNKSVEGKYIPLRGGEASLARFSPTLYAGIHSALDLIPYAPLLALPSERDSFMQLDQHDQTMLLLEHDLGLALMAFTGPLGKDAQYLMGKLPFKIGKLLNAPMEELAEKARLKWGASYGVHKPKAVVPFEDAVRRINSLGQKEIVTPFSYGEEVKKKLLNKGFADDEAEAVTGALMGEDSGLQNTVMERAFQGKKMTKAFETATELEKGRLYQKRVLKQVTKDIYSKEAMSGKFYGRLFESVLEKEVLHTVPTQTTIRAIFENQLRRSFPKKLEEEGAKIGYGDLTPVQMVNLVADMIENKAVSWRLTYPTTLATLHPARVVFGIGEEALGTKTLIYDKMAGSLGRKNRNYFNHSLLFAKMLEQSGAYTKIVTKETGEFVVTKAPWLTGKVLDEVYKVSTLMDNLSQKLLALEQTKGKEEAIAAIRKEIGQAANGLSKEGSIVLSTTRKYLDHLYNEHVKLEIPRQFRKAGLTRIGQTMVDKFMSGPNGVNYEVDRLFSSIAETNHTERVAGMKKILEGVRKRLEYGEEMKKEFPLKVDGKLTEAPLGAIGKHPYFTAEGEELQKALGELNLKMSWNKPGGFLNYLDNYIARVANHEDVLLQNWRATLYEGREAFYAKIRQLERMKGDPVDFGTMIQARTEAQAKEHFLYDTIDEVVATTKKLPPAWVEYTEGYLGGILNTPTLSDYKVAMFLTKTVGGLERFFGKAEGLWSEQRVHNLAYTANTLAYLGGLGFKPFGALRNYFQYIMNVPGDLGGVKDLGKLVGGVRWAFNPENRQYLIRIGAIEEYAPEIYLRPAILPQGKVVAGYELPQLERIRDFGLWMFKGSDRHVRYATGGAATLKWEGVYNSFNKQVLPRDVSRFSKQLGLGGRYEWVKSEIEDLLLRGKLSEAKAVYVKDVIKDTQYLYGVADAPVILRKHGAIGKTGFLFQSWFMNYGTLLEKWITRGESPGKQAERMFVAMFSQAVGYTLMDYIWGKNTAVRSTFLGPFPNEFNEFLIPPTWKPIYNSYAAIANIQSPHISAKHAKAVLDSSTIMVPAGLQMRMLYKGAKADGFSGFSRAIIGMKPSGGAEPDSWFTDVEQEADKIFGD